MNSAYRIFPIGDAALTIDLGNTIDPLLNEKVLALFETLQQQPVPGMVEAVPAYSSLTVYYNLLQVYNLSKGKITGYDFIKAAIEERLSGHPSSQTGNGRHIEVPVCYDRAFAPGLTELAKAKGLSVDEVISIHTGHTYRVYMLGFLPGFAYMGQVDERISMPRKNQPENVAAGSVGIAGVQTGIYPLASPGGWCIIGRTPISLFDAEAEDQTYFKAGDTVRFLSISKDEFESYQSRHS